MADRLALRYAARSDVGLVRASNEDSGYAGGHMLVVADGMGGHAAGELASATAIATFAELDYQPPGEEALTALADAVEDAHQELSRVVSAAPDFSGMGTTVTALSWEGDRVAIAHVGDSRAYLLRDGTLSQITHDHSYVQSLVDAGKITPEEATTHEKRNLLMKALDGMNSVEPDVSIREVKPGDRFLLCTDGLSGVVSDSEIAELLSQGDPTGCVTQLVDKALEGGAPDNVTCVVADVVLESGPETVSEADMPTPVVVGAAAERRNRDQLPGLAFPADAQPNPDELAVDPTPRAQPLASLATDPDLAARGHIRRNALIAISAVVGILIVAVGGFFAWTQTQFYVGEASGQVAIYQGIPGGPGEHGFSKAVATSATQVTALPTIFQQEIMDTIPAKDRDAANNVVAQLALDAAKCAKTPTPDGCPSPAPSPGATP